MVSSVCGVASRFATRLYIRCIFFCFFFFLVYDTTLYHLSYCLTDKTTESALCAASSRRRRVVILEFRTLVVFGPTVSLVRNLKILLFLYFLEIDFIKRTSWEKQYAGRGALLYRRARGVCRRRRRRRRDSWDVAYIIVTRAVVVGRVYRSATAERETHKEKRDTGRKTIYIYIYACGTRNDIAASVGRWAAWKVRG